jgi:hypothetical protein
MDRMQENLKKSSSIRRGLSFATIVLNGHLFDTQFFNKAIDILTKNELDFRVIELEIGHHNS